MAKVCMINREEKRAHVAKRDAVKRDAFKKEILAAETLEGKMEAMAKLNKLDRNGAKVRGRNRCSFTGRPHAYYRAFGISRIMLREMASNGLLPGVRKASW
ncbi:MAG: 30S ribosomal protein S14 [Alphaproteobacteria bacterium CG_4_10_14_0_8_um_filter_53_9]|nr:MAG: 30S ribosomal protein S14 [Alphaproteobacteria bacterium CG_4_10_14_0_8_um_filter_53_9]